MEAGGGRPRGSADQGLRAATPAQRQGRDVATPVATPLEGVRVLVDRVDSDRASEDARALTAAGADVREVVDLHRELVDAGPGQPVVLLLDVSAPVLRRHSLSGLQPALGDGFCVVVGSELGSATRSRLLRDGADDCLDGAYLPEELVARTAALVRRQPVASSDLLLSAGLQLDARRRTVHLRDVAVPVTQREFELLVYLLRHPDVVLSRERLLSHVWGYDFGNTETVTVHVRRLRAKIESDPGQPQRIRTVRGVGYLYTTPHLPEISDGPQQAGPSPTVSDPVRH